MREAQGRVAHNALAGASGLWLGAIAEWGWPRIGQHGVMDMAKSNDAVWVELDPASLDAGQSVAYEEYRRLRKLAGVAKGAFEQTMQVAIPVGQRMIFGYNFGRLSVAVVANDRPASKPKATAKSLGDYLATMSARGEAH